MPGLRGTPWFVRHAALVAVLAVLLFTSYVRLRVAPVPLERDEGEYAYAGQLILHGTPPYVLAYNMKFPGPYYAYAAIMAIFGQTPWGIHVGLLLVNVATTLVLFFLARRLLGSPTAAAVSAGAFALMSVDRWILGVFAHATHFVLLPALAGLLMLARASGSKRWADFLGAGVLLGIAVLMKQHAIAFALFGFGWLLWDGRRPARDLPRTVRHALVVAAGVILPFAILGLVFAAHGVLGRFWFWTFHYAREYVSEIPIANAGFLLNLTWELITRATLWFWLLGAAGLAALWLVRWPAGARVWMTGFAICSAAAVVPGFYFRAHYFILLLPAVALLAGVAIVSVERVAALAMPRDLARGLALACALAVAGDYVVVERDYLFAMDPHDLSRSVYSTSPFLEAPAVGRYLQDHTSPGDRIAVLGSEPEIYFYAQRASASGYVYMYPFFEPQSDATRMVTEWMEEVETARPRYVVYASVSSSWTEHPAEAQEALQWAKAYVRDCYDLVGVADIDAAHTTMLWDEAARGYQPKSPNVVYTLRRRADGPCTAAR